MEGQITHLLKNTPAVSSQPSRLLKQVMLALRNSWSLILASI